MYRNNGFMNYMGYRNMLIEEKVQECLDIIRNGGTHINIDAGDLSASEICEVEREVHRRVERGDY